MNDKHHTQCIACLCQQVKPLRKFKSQQLVVCNNCGLVFDRRIPSPELLTDHYSTYSYSRRKPVSTATQKSFSLLLNQFESYRQTNNILDVGCGQGDFLIAAKSRGWNVYGSEYSQAAVKLCQEADITMLQGEYYSEAFGNMDFDIVTSFEVLEHTNQPHIMISALLSNLRAGGLFYLTTPNFNALLRLFEQDQFKILGYPEHIALYTPISLYKLLQKYPLKQKKLLATGIDITRLKSSIRLNPEKQAKTIFNPQANMAANEAFRENFSYGKMSYIKAAVNQLLTWTGKGDTLKAFYIKK
jgi:2-polyprenyl-3-methyl-5-hydroxy-6-metoxy-1,4-benzoquinol methylase